jgi:hypothetical protein
MRMAKVIPLTTLLLVASDVSAQQASDHPLFSDDWLFRLGGQNTDAEVSFGLANETLGEIPVYDLDGAGVDTDFGSFWAHVIWQAPERWSFGFNYFRSEVDGERIADEDIFFGDLEIPAGTGYQSEFVTNFYVLNGYYEFFQRPNQAAGVGLGIYALEMDLQLQSLIGGQTGATQESADTLAPLPTLSLYYKHAFNDRWAIWADMGYFSANIDKYDGEIVAGRVSLDYWINKNWGLGVGYNYVDVDLTVDERIYDQRYKVQWDSFFLFLTAGF